MSRLRRTVASPLLTEAAHDAAPAGELSEDRPPAPRKGASGPFNALLRSPEVADRVPAGGRVRPRFQTTIPGPRSTRWRS